MTVHLIIDAEWGLHETRGVSFHLNTAAKHPENPVLVPGMPHAWDSLQVSWPGTVLYDADAGMFRCWYSGFDAVQTPERWWKPGYAESRDGVHWEKPALGQVTYLDRPTNQLRIDWPFIVLGCVFRNPAPDAPPAQRYGALFSEWAPDAGPELARKGLAWSPDGLQWTRAGHATPVGHPGDWQGSSYQDINQLLFCPDAADPEARVVGFAQHYTPRWDGRLVRHIGRVHGPDPAHLSNSDPIVALAPVEGIDEELHFASVHRAGDAWLMLFESDCFSRQPLHGDLKLAVSRDGSTFRRVHPRTPLIATGDRGAWDANMLVTTTATVQCVGDTLYCFYFGVPLVYTEWPSGYSVTPECRGAMFYPACLGLATLPRDRYAYARGAGTLTTESLVIGEDGLWLNADGDRLTVTARDMAGDTVLATGTLGDERRQTVYRRVVWAGAPPSGRCRVTVMLGQDDRLYSLQA